MQISIICRVIGISVDLILLIQSKIIPHNSQHQLCVPGTVFGLRCNIMYYDSMIGSISTFADIIYRYTQLLSSDSVSTLLRKTKIFITMGELVELSIVHQISICIVAQVDKFSQASVQCFNINMNNVMRHPSQVKHLQDSLFGWINN